MMFRLFLIPLSAILLASCSQAPSPGSAADSLYTFTVDKPCAVIFRPTGDKLRALKAAFGEKSFSGLMEVNNSTLIADSQFLASKGVKIFSTSLTHLKFVQPLGEPLFINLNHEKYAWEIFLYRGAGDPVKADLTDIEGSYRESGLK